MFGVDDAAAAAIISSAASAGSQGYNAFAQGKMNRRTLRYNKWMYEKQKQDNLDFWRMQNEYNSPVAQMQRFKDAGLNPNLIYGRGESGNAGSLSAPAAHSFNPRAPQFNADSVIGQYYDTQAKQGQINNLGAQNDVLKAEAKLKEAQAVSTLLSNWDKDFRNKILQGIGVDNFVEKEFRNISLLGARGASESWRAELLQQKYFQLEKTNPVAYKQMKKVLEKLGIDTEAAEKNKNLIGLSDKTEIGSVLRFLFTVFGLDTHLTK